MLSPARTCVTVSFLPRGLETTIKTCFVSLVEEFSQDKWAVGIVAMVASKISTVTFGNPEPIASFDGLFDTYLLLQRRHFLKVYNLQITFVRWRNW